MARRFNPPPNWPAAPEGWEPPEGWQPDPGWGPAPAGWEVWPDDADRSRRVPTWATVLGSLVAAVLVFLAGVAVGAGDGGTPGASGPGPTVTVTATPAPTRDPALVAGLDAANTAARDATTRAEQAAAEAETAGAHATELQATLASAQQDAQSSSSASVYFENCDDARARGAAPVRAGDPGYASHLDRDGDGVGCE